MHQSIPVLVKLILTKSGVGNGFLEESVAKSVLGHIAQVYIVLLYETS
jgi:hypothetical protein